MSVGSNFSSLLTRDVERGRSGLTSGGFDVTAPLKVETSRERGLFRITKRDDERKIHNGQHLAAHQADGGVDAGL